MTKFEWITNEWFTQEREEQVKQLTAEMYAIDGMIDDRAAEDKQAAEDFENIQLKIERTTKMAGDHQRRAQKSRKSTSKTVEEASNLPTSKILCERLH